jgi:ribose transport system permease protein
VPTVQTMQTNDALQSAAAEPPARPESRTLRPSRPLGARLLHGLSFSKIGAVYVWLAIVVVFSIWVPDTFPTMSTVKQVLNANAITALAALAITIPLAARVFDLSFAYTMTLTGVITAHFLSVGVPLAPALLLGLGAGIVIGVINAVVVVVMRIDSFIATLATGSLIQALITMATGGTAIISTRLQGGFSKIGQTNVSGFTLPVLYVLVVAIVMWFVLEHTATGRRLYATGFNPDAAKLAGVRVDRLRFISLVVSGSLAGAAGLVLASTLGSGDPSAGTSYLLPAFAAAFLGATQLKHGRFNAFGTLIAVLLLGTGTTGLGLANAPQWSADMFVGVVLIASLALTGIQRRAIVGHGGRVRSLLHRLRPSHG